MSDEPCGICGGDCRISNSFGLTTTCPGCHGTGRRSAETSLMRDVTKTKPSHHRSTNKVDVVAKTQWPLTPSGVHLATLVRDFAGLTADTKARLTREIIEHEESHGLCTQTFARKIKKQIH